MKENMLDKIKQIFKRVAVILGVPTVLLLPNTSCGTEQQPTNNADKENNNHTSFVEGLREDVPTTQSELNKVVIEDETTEIIPPITQTTTEPTTQIATQTTINVGTIFQGTITKPNSQTQEALYNKLLNSFNAEFNKKGFSDTAYKYLKAVFDETYKNYDQWQQISKDLPSKEEYMNTYIIGAIKDIKDMQFYSKNSKEAQERLEKGYRLGYITRDNKIIIIYDDSSEENFRNDVEMTAHELQHVITKVRRDESYFNNYPFLEDIIEEGGATARMKYTNKLKTEKLAANNIKLGEYKLKYKSDNEQGYHKEMNIYNNLTFLVGFDVMQKVDLGEAPIDIIKETIEQKYGENTSNKIFEELEKWYNGYQEGDSAKKMQSATNLQNLFLDCIEKDIENLKTEEEVIKYANIYRAYKINNLARVYKNEEDITDEYFNIDELDKKMAEKMSKYKSFQFTSDKKQNQDAIMCLLYTTDKQIGKGEDILITANLCATNCVYKDGAIYFAYYNETDYAPGARDVSIELEKINGDIKIEEKQIPNKNQSRNNNEGYEYEDR